MRSCATCHSRSWYRDEVAIDLAAALEAVATNRAAERGAGAG